jgi:hypothetical protein
VLFGQRSERRRVDPVRVEQVGVLTKPARFQPCAHVEAQESILPLI